MINFKDLEDILEKARLGLIKKLEALDLSALEISDYNKKYLGDKLCNIKNVMSLYKDIFSVALKDFLTHKSGAADLKNLTIIDYGGGYGLISFFALESGIGQVVYNDIYDVSCRDAKILASALKLELNHIVCGDTQALAEYVNKNSLKISFIISYDVLEHIYNLKNHFSCLTGINTDSFKIYHASGANILNPFIRKKITSLQNKAEFTTRTPKKGSKKRDTHESYLSVREKIIHQHAPNLCQSIVKQLAEETRGLIIEDIQNYTDNFLNGKKDFNINKNHSLGPGSNTCDPYTGNWCEHLIEHAVLIETLKNAGFSNIHILPGKYCVHTVFLKKYLKIFLNLIISIFPGKAVKIAPYFILKALYKKNQNTEDTKLNLPNQTC
jgi:hypothetical protein